MATFSRRALGVLETLIPPGVVPGVPGLIESGFEAFYAERFARRAPLAMRLVFHVALFAAAWLSPLMIGRAPPLTRLDQDAREAALMAMGQSRFYVIRQLLLLLKTTVTLHFGEDERVRRAIGYPEQFDGGRGAGALASGEGLKGSQPHAS